MIETDDGNLYTFGTGKYGCLGHGDTKAEVLPKLVSFFSKNQLKVVDVACGASHTVALTSDGRLWSWGRARRNFGFFMNILFPATGALGYKVKSDVLAPKEIPRSFLEMDEEVTSLFSGMTFSGVLTSSKNIYMWGRGEYGVFGDGSNKQRVTPKINGALRDYRLEKGLSVEVIKSCNYYSSALMSDGNMYSFGANEFGQMGLSNNVGVEFYESIEYPTPITVDYLEDVKIVQHAVGERTTVILTEDNRVFMSGNKFAYTPQQLPIDPTEKVKMVASGSNSVAVVLGTLPSSF